MTKQRGPKRARINRLIKAPQIRLIGADGEQVGVVTNNEAQQAALEAGQDLVEISPNADPPVCRIMDFGKYLFEQSKKLAVAKKKQKQIQLKEIKFRPTTDEGDYQVKLRNLIKFLGQGNKTKIVVRFRGREMTHQELGKRLLDRVTEDLQEYGIVEQVAKLEGRQMVMVMGPSTKAKKAQTN